MRHVDENIPGVFFLDGPGGTENTFLYKVLLANIRAYGLIALATPTSGVATNKMPRGRTTHSRFRIPPNIDITRYARSQNKELSFAMTINKAQGQTIPNVGVYLPESVFSHGQLYVALSRGISRVNTKVLVKPEKTFDSDGIYISNDLYKEVLRD
ncbi:uncharacterized protein LOC128133429 [Lactuca sativa]|uniref:uncharacterized protein LOC128133429 n=1 Tax=Lactuca sativa TaxID=4236 RepID=UPI000CD9EB87|nr:uncharacterized protein LOC128133429 [Lactuca sativa]